LPAVLDRAAEAGVESIVCVGISAETSEAAVALAEQHPMLYAAVGIQPNSCAEVKPGDWERIIALAEHSRVVALGETGLDRYWDFAPFDVQQDYFERHLQLSAERDLPVIIHSRQCDDDMLAMLEAAAGRGPLRAVMHAFSSDVAVARRCVELGLYVSFAGMVSYTNKKFGSLREAAAAVPDDRLLVETDSPYLVPHPLRGTQKRNEPALIVHTAKCLAEVRGVRVDDLASATTANARRLFGLP
jgi:TatD DNase family protein